MLSRPSLLHGARVGALCALVGLTSSGCDLVGSSGSDLLSAPSSSERSRTEDAITDEGGDACNVTVEAITDSESGALASGDCTLGDDSFVDFYAFTVEDDADVRIEMESGDFPPYLLLQEVDLGATAPISEVTRDENTSESDLARITETLRPGLYVVYANSITSGQSGDYTLTVEADASGN